MNREEFLRQLEALLHDIPEEERVEALTYYRSYFEDAGENKEADIIKELESPQKVAESIKADLAGDGSAAGFRADANQGNAQYGNNPYPDAAYVNNVNQTISNLQRNEKKHSAGEIVLIIIVAILTSPIWLSLAGIVISIIISVFALLFGIIIAVIATVGACIITGCAVLGVGFGAIFSGSPAVALALIGVGLLILAAGILAIVLLIWICGGLLPWLCKKIGKLYKKLFRRKRKGSMAV